MTSVLHIHGTVSRDGSPVEAAYVNLIDPQGLFVAERRTGPDGGYSFHTTAGKWTLEFLTSGSDKVEREVEGDGEVSLDVDLT